MVARTHDLGAMTALNIAFVVMPIPSISLATALTCIGANFIGGLAPDLDNQSSHLWRRVRGGSIWGRILSPLLGGHRLISHSLLGTIISGGLFWLLLSAISEIVLVDMYFVWWAFMIGFISHLFLDSFTRQGIPLLFPLPYQIGIPPLRRLRIRTGGVAEKALVFPLLMLTNFYLVYNYYPKYISFLNVLLGIE